MLKNTSLIVAAVAAMLALAGNSSQAAIVSNPGFEFIAGGHTNGDSASHSVQLDATNTPFWKPATSAGGFTAITSDPQSIFANNPNEYIQIQIISPGGSQDAYQQITIPSVGDYTLTMDSGHRTDNVSLDGLMFLELWLGNVTSFSSGSPITPDSQVSPTLSATIQQFSRTFNSLAPGAYTVRVGGTHVGPGAIFQASIDNVNITAVPEPTSLGLLGMLGLLARRRR